MRLPSAPGNKLDVSQMSTIDYSCASSGYVTIVFRDQEYGKVRINCGTHQQDFSILGDNTPTVIPLCYGDGDYTIGVYRHISGSSYQLVNRPALHVTVKLVCPVVTWLYPNTYCNYTFDSLCVKKADGLCKGRNGDMAKISMIYRWICANVRYDNETAVKVVKGEVKGFWLPDPDTVMRTCTGICWEYASLFAAMLRSQDIPCKICVGKTANTPQLHAWVEVYSLEKGILDGINIRADGWEPFDITFMDTDAYNGDKPPSLIAYVNKDENYIVDYYG